MTLNDLHQILGSPFLQEVLIQAKAFKDDPLRLQAFLRQQAIPPSLSRAMAGLAALRRRARAKFTCADRMYFTKQSLEQATSELVARHRARRFVNFQHVADLCCGIGGDTIALAEKSHVAAVDREMLLLRMAYENARTYEVEERVHCVCADVRQFPLKVEAAFLDPSRRVGGWRVQELEAMSPPISFVPELLGYCPNVAVKLSPAADYESLPWDCEVEIISEGGECKEATLWFGEMKTCRRRATLLPSGDTLTDEPVGPVPVTEPEAFLYEPEAAVIRSHLVEVLAAHLKASKLDPQIAYLTSDEYVQTPFAAAFRVEETFKLDIKTIRRSLMRREVGRIVIKKRGVDVSPEKLHRDLALEGPNEAVLVLTRLQGRPHVLLCSSIKGSPEQRQRP